MITTHENLMFPISAGEPLLIDTSNDKQNTDGHSKLAEALNLFVPHRSARVYHADASDAIIRTKLKVVGPPKSRRRRTKNPK